MSTIPSGLTEELALAQAQVVEYQELARDLWRGRYYQRARHYWAHAKIEREYVAELERRLAEGEVQR